MYITFSIYLHLSKCKYYFYTIFGLICNHKSVIQFFYQIKPDILIVFKYFKSKLFL